MMTTTPVNSARILMQQCLSARLQIVPASETSESQWVQIDRGVAMFVCFLQGSNEEVVKKMVKSALNVKLCEADDGSYKSVLNLPGSILIIPQATLGGKLKGNSVQYHRNVDRQTGEQLYTNFVQLCENTVKSCVADADVKVEHGTYGNRQVLKLDTNGPFSHVIDF